MALIKLGSVPIVCSNRSVFPEYSLTFDYAKELLKVFQGANLFPAESHFGYPAITAPDWPEHYVRWIEARTQ